MPQIKKKFFNRLFCNGLTPVGNPVSPYQTFAVLSQPAVIFSFPSLLNTALFIPFVCFIEEVTNLLVARLPKAGIFIVTCC